MGVAGGAVGTETGSLNGTGGVDPPADVGRGFGGSGVSGQFIVFQRRHIHAEVDAVQHGAGQAAEVAVDGGLGAGAASAGVAVPAAFAGVHGAHQHESAGVGDRAGHPGDLGLAVLQRLTQHFQHFGVEFRQFIQKQHAVVGQRDLAGAEAAAAARHTGCGNSMVGRTEGTAGDHGMLPAGEAHNGVDLRAGQSLLPGQIGENGGQALGHHGLARSRTARHQNMVPAGRRDLQRPLGLLLPLDLGEIGAVDGAPGGSPGLGREDGFLSTQVPCKLLDGGDGNDLDPLGKGGFRGVIGRDEQAGEPGAFGRQRHGQSTADRPKLTGQGQLAEERGVLHAGEGKLPSRGQNTHQNGKVVDRADFLAIGGGQIDGDAGHREVKATGLDGGTDAFPGFLYCGVGKADDVKGGQTAGQGALRTDRVAGYAVETQRLYGTDHGIHLKHLC